jgi:predicted DCC family thiol-disulfide oxidoreductase YuxK
MKERPVILFDGVCNFCNRIVIFVMKKDKLEQIMFTPIQSDKGVLYLKQFGLPYDKIESFVFIEDGKAYQKSMAALKVCRHLKGLWPLCYGFIIVPKFIRDGVYNWVAKNRYKWFGVRQECVRPTEQTWKRFI